MKRMRFFMIWFLLLTTAACVPTPTVEYVINKADGVLEQKLADRDEAPVESFPDRWETSFTTRDGLPITVDADVIGKEDPIYPVYRTEYDPVTPSDAAAFFRALLPEPVSMAPDEPTKEERTQAFADFLDAVEQQRAGTWYDDTDWTDEEVERMTEAYLAEIAEAPSAREPEPLADFAHIPAGGAYRVDLETGEQASVQWSAHGVQFTRGGGETYGEPWQKTDARLGEPDAALWRDVELTREQAEQMLSEALQKLGMEDFDVAAAYPANQMNFGMRAYAVTTGWEFVLRRTFGYPAELRLQPSQRLSYADSTAVSRPIADEECILFIAQDGVRCAYYGTPKAVRGLANPNVALLPWETVTRLAEHALTAGLSGHRGLVTVYRIVLTTYTLPEKDSDAYLEVPCWALYYGDAWAREHADDPSVSHDALLLNAIDGSTVRVGYAE